MLYTKVQNRHRVLHFQCIHKGKTRQKSLKHSQKKLDIVLLLNVFVGYVELQDYVNIYS